MSTPTETSTRTREKIERLVRERLIPRQSDIVAAVDELLSIAAERGEMRAAIPADRHVKFEVGSRESWEFEFDLARSRVRTICARLAKLVEENGQEFLPYGGEGTIRKAAPSTETNGAPGQNTMTWRARWKNTTDVQEFVIQAQ